MTFVNKILESTVDLEYPTEGRHEFRISSFPYCPVLDYIAQRRDEEFNSSYNMDFYTGIGTVVHENIQQKASMTKYGAYVYGSFKCSHCGSISTIGFRPHKCPNCGSKLMDYIELEFKYKGISGHLDMLACYPCDKKGNFLHIKNRAKRLEFCRKMVEDPNNSIPHKWVAFEFKTTGTKYVVDYQYQRYLPQPKHFGQVESYCVFLNLLYNIKVAEYSIIYFSRECPKDSRGKYYFKSFSYPFTEDTYDFRLWTIERAIQGRKSVEALLEKKNDKRYERMLNCRPCKKCKLDWEQYMQKAFFKDEKCVFYKKCLEHSIDRKTIESAIKG